MKLETTSKFKETEVGLIPEEWGFDPLEKHAKILMGQSPESAYFNQSEEGTVFLQGVRTFGKKYPSYDTWTTKVTKLAETNSVLLSVRAPVGEVNIATQDVCIGRGLMAINGQNNEFLYQLLKAHKSYIVGKETGTIYGSVTRDDIAKIRLPFPSTDEQEKIAEILSSIDNKIELNYRINANFEKFASTLFRHSFIDVDIKLSKGWKKGTLLDIAYNERQTISPSDIVSETPYIGLEHMPRKSVALTEWETVHDLKSGKFKFNKGDVLFGKLRPYFHKVGIAPVDGVCSTDILVLRPNMKEGMSFLLCVVSSIAFINYVSAAAEGTKMPRTNWETMSAYPITLPPAALIKQFNETIGPLLEMINENTHQIRMLAEVRDFLLPRLMNGKIRV